MSLLDITEVTRRSGLPASTLRFYEEEPLIASVGRRGLHRLFETEVLDKLALIALGRAAGFSLDEISRMFAPNGWPRIDRDMLSAKAAELGPTFLRLSRAAASVTLTARGKDRSDIEPIATTCD